MSSSEVGVVTLTVNPAVDRAFMVDAMEPERKLRSEGSQDSAGGGGINVARALHELGHSVLAVWMSGGPMGALLAGLLERDGVPNLPVAIESLTRQNLIAFEASTGRQFRFGFPGPMLRDEEAAACLDALRGAARDAGIAVLSGSLPPDVDQAFYAEAARAVPKGCRVVLDSSGPALRRAVDAGVFLVKPNARELEALAGRRLSDVGQMVGAANEVVGSGGAKAVAVSLGSQGALLVDAEGSASVPSPAVDAASVVGAGDSMVAGMVAGMVRGLTMRDALRLGVAAGAAAVSCAGTGLCRRVDVDALFERTRLADLAQDEVAQGSR